MYVSKSRNKHFAKISCNKVQNLERCNGIAEVWVRLPASLNFFRLSFRNWISCVFNCDDLLCIYFLISRFQYIKFI